MGITKDTDKDDFKVKGDDGTHNGKLIGVVEDALKVSPINEVTVNISNQNTDLFDRLAVAEDVPLWSYSHRYDDDIALYWDTKLTGTGNTITHDADKVVEVINNGTANANESIYRTYRYFEYSKGRMQSFFVTVNPKGAVANVTKKWGCFDDDNGLFFHLNGTSPELVIRSKTSGSVSETVISRASWDDPMDGTGASGITIDFTKLNLYYIQFAWLGGNAVEWGVFQDGQKFAIHRAPLSNLSETSYSQSANLPFNFEVKNNAALGAASTLEVNCLAVFNNGIQDQLGEVFGVDTGTTEQSISTSENVIAAIRMQSSLNQASLRALNFNLVSPSGNSTIYYKVEIGGTFTGDSWSSISNSIAEGLSSFSSYTNGFVLQSGYVQAGQSIQVEEILSNLYIGRDIDGNSQVLALIAQTINSTAKVLFSGRFREYK
jgi:hypothetical protein